MNIKDFSKIYYLENGNDKQKESYKILRKINIFNILKDYTPLLVGTIPLGIDIENSDLDIVCQVCNFEVFEHILINNFSKYEEFNMYYKEKDILICNFSVEGMEIEIYASNIESYKTNGYRHMIIEYKLLNLYGELFKEKVIELKRKGLKTEPAFAKLLNLKGNPYESLLEYEKHLLD